MNSNWKIIRLFGLIWFQIFVQFFLNCCLSKDFILFFRKSNTVTCLNVNSICILSCKAFCFFEKTHTKKNRFQMFASCAENPSCMVRFKNNQLLFVYVNEEQFVKCSSYLHFGTLWCLHQGTWLTQLSTRFHHWGFTTTPRTQQKLIPTDPWKTQKNWKQQNKNANHNFTLIGFFFFIVLLNCPLKNSHIRSNSNPFSRFKITFAATTFDGFWAQMYKDSFTFLPFRISHYQEVTNFSNPPRVLRFLLRCA